VVWKETEMAILTEEVTCPGNDQIEFVMERHNVTREQAIEMLRKIGYSNLFFDGPLN